MKTSASAVATARGAQPRDLRKRVRDPSLTALLIIQLCAIFVAAPLAALGLSWARPVGEALVLAIVLITLTLSTSRGAIISIVIGLGAILAHLVPVEHPTAYTNVFPRGGSILMFAALTWVVARAVYAPGREAIIGQLYPATILARLFTLELEDRRR